MLSRADDVDGVALAVSGVHDYKYFFDAVGMNGGMNASGPGNMAGGSGGESKSLEDMFYQKEMEISKVAFTRQFTHAVIYAWVRLREQVSLSSPYYFVMLTWQGNTQHHMDCRMHSTKPEGKDRELYQCVLIYC